MYNADAAFLLSYYILCYDGNDSKYILFVVKNKSYLLLSQVWRDVENTIICWQDFDQHITQDDVH